MLYGIVPAKPGDLAGSLFATSPNPGRRVQEELAEAEPCNRTVLFYES